MAARATDSGALTGPGEAPSCAGALSFGDRTRAFLKVQEGCDLRCSYCIIPEVRGPSLSVPPELLAAQLQRLIDAGYRGYVGIEFEGEGVDEPEGIRRTKVLLERVRDEMTASGILP